MTMEIKYKMMNNPVIVNGHQKYKYSIPSTSPWLTLKSRLAVFVRIHIVSGILMRYTVWVLRG
jgi:hypothetical protein